MKDVGSLLKSVARGLLWARIARWLCASLIIVLVPLALLLWADSLLVVSTAWRWVALVLAVSTGLGVTMAFTQFCRRLQEKEATAALDAASSLRDGYAISTSHELSEKNPADPLEAAMLARLHAQARQLAAEARVAYPWPAAWMVLLALAAVALFFPVGTKEHGLALKRALQPWCALPYTTLKLQGPANPPARREAFSLSGKVSGRIPKSVRLSWTGGREATVPVNPDGTFVYTLVQGVQQVSTFVAEAGADGRSLPLEISLRRVPKVLAHHFGLTPPEYTGWPKSEESHSGLNILRGTKVVLTLQLDLPVTAVTFNPDNNSGSIALQNPSGDGITWEADLGKMVSTFSYQIRLQRGNYACDAEDNPPIIIIRQDNPPKIEHFKNNADKFDKNDYPDDFTLNYQITDDIGLGNVHVACQTLKHHLAGQPDTIFQQRTLEASNTWAIPLKELQAAGVEPLDLVVFQMVVSDNNTLDGPGVAVSEPVFLEMPFPKKEKKDGAPGDGNGDKGNKGGEKATTINPLAMQKDLHRDILRANYGFKELDPKAVTEREQDIGDALDHMIADPENDKLGEEYMNNLKRAKRAVGIVTNALARGASRSSVVYTRGSGEVLGDLIEAAKIEAAAGQKEDSDPGDPSQPKQSQDGPPKTQYSLTKKPNPGDKPGDDPSDEGDPSQLVSETKKLSEEQAKQNQEMKDAQAEQSQTQNPKGDQGEEDQQKPHGHGKPSHPATPAERAARQQAIKEKTEALIKKVERLGRMTDRQTDPKQTADALKAAKDFQQKAIEAIRANNHSHAIELAENSKKAIDRAVVLAKSLMEKQVRQSVEAQAQAPGYESLIQDYSRRLSYDQ